jgi:hypothetical protein
VVRFYCRHGIKYYGAYRTGTSEALSSRVQGASNRASVVPVFEAMRTRCCAPETYGEATRFVSQLYFVILQLDR